MKVVIGFQGETYGSVSDEPTGKLRIKDNADGCVRSTIQELRSWVVGGKRQRLSDHDLLRTLPVRLNGYNWANIEEATDDDRAEVDAWRAKALIRSQIV